MARKSIFVRDFYFNSTNDSFVKEVEQIPPELRKVLTTYKYKSPKYLPTGIVIKKDDPPLTFRLTPETLLNLTIKFLDKITLPNVYTWDIEQVCRWLRRYGFPQYQVSYKKFLLINFYLNIISKLAQNTFRVNLINGRTLLLLDASALSAMNIRDFDHIRRIAYGIRCLFHFEMTKFGRSLTLAPEYHMELYKLLRVKNGTKYDRSTIEDLWRRMQLIRPRSGCREHWEILEKWLEFEPAKIERVGGIHRYDLYKCKKAPEHVHTEEKVELKPCNCMPPCECYWTERETRAPWKLNLVPDEAYETVPIEQFMLTVLRRAFPDRYRDQSIEIDYY